MAKLMIAEIVKCLRLPWGYAYVCSECADCNYFDGIEDGMWVRCKYPEECIPKEEMTSDVYGKG